MVCLSHLLNLIHITGKPKTGESRQNKKTVIFMALSDVKTDENWFKTFDEKGKHISTMASSGKELVCIGSDFFVCLEGAWIKTYDENCKHIETMSSSGKTVRVAAGQTFTCKEGSFMKTYDKNCKHLNTRSA